MKLKLSFALALLFSVQLIGNAALAQKKKKYDAVVRTTDGRRYKGVLTVADEKGISIAVRGRTINFEGSKVSDVKIRSHNSLNKNMLGGAVLGLGSAYLIYNNQHQKGKTTAVVLPVVVVGSFLYGAAAGALFNSFFAKERFHDVSRHYKEFQPKLNSYVYTD